MAKQEVQSRKTKLNKKSHEEVNQIVERIRRMNQDTTRVIIRKMLTKIKLLRYRYDVNSIQRRINGIIKIRYNIFRYNLVA